MRAGDRTDRPVGVRGRLASIGLGLLLAAGSIVPATAAEAATTTTVRGTVQAGTTKLAGVPVGFWSRTGRSLATTTTGSTGAFTLKVPSGVRGFAYAGARPDSLKAVFLLGTKPYIRGVIGATQGSTSYTLYQGHPSAVAADLAGGGALRFRLQRPGTIRVEGGVAFQGPPLDGTARIQVHRLNGAPFLDIGAKLDGVATSQRLVPGRYAVRLTPCPPYLPQTVAVTVVAGRSLVLKPTFVRGATVQGTVTTATGKPAADVRVTVGDLNTGRTDTTDAQGHYSITAVTAGTHPLRIGYNPQPDRNAEEGPEEPDRVPPPTSDDVLPKVLSITVGADHATVTKNVEVAPAGHLKGAITGTTSGIQVWLEDAGHQVIRAAQVTSFVEGRATYAIGGLRPGQAYRVLARTTDEPSARWGSRTFTATAGTLTRAIAVDRNGLTLRGHAANAPSGSSVNLRAHGTLWPILTAGGSSVDASGNYVLRGAIPGVYDVTVSAAHRVDSRPVLLTLTASTTKDLAAGPKAGGYTVRFRSGAAPAQRTGAQARSTAGDLIGFGTSVGYTATGRATATGVRPGSYSYLASSFRNAAYYDAPVSDGPWWFGAVSRTFTVTAGRITDDGTIALHVRSTR